MEEIAEFVGGHMDGRTATVAIPAPDIIRVPVPVNFSLTAEGPSDIKPSLGVEDYKRIGRNDAGRLRYLKLAR